VGAGTIIIGLPESFEFNNRIVPAIKNPARIDNKYQKKFEPFIK
jgi:hypothetical protein